MKVVYKQRDFNKLLPYLLFCKTSSRRRQWQPTPVLLPGKSHGRRGLVGAVLRVTKSWTRRSDFTFTFHFHALEKEMATHSSVLAWRIPGTGEPGGLSSMGSHRVGHDWSDLAAAAARQAQEFLLSASVNSMGYGFRLGGFNNKHLFYIVLEARKSKIRVPGWSSSGEVPLHGLSLATFLLYPSMIERAVICLHLLIGALISS